jgi:PAS domain S-box-containing protein
MHPSIVIPQIAAAEKAARAGVVARSAAISVAVAVGYYAGSIVGFALTLPGHSVSMLWPPNAILLAALLLLPAPKWWLVFLGAFPAHVAIQFQSGVPSLMALCWFVSNSCEALIAAWGLRLVKRQVDFSSLKEVAFYLGFAALLAPFLSSFLDAAFVVAAAWKEQSYWDVWATRFTSNVLAALAIPPVIVLWITRGAVWLKAASWTRYAEAVVLCAGLVAVSWFVFGWQTPGSAHSPAVLYLPLPFLLWAAVRFGSGGATSALLIVVLVSIFGATEGGGPFMNSSPAENVFSLQMFLMAISLPILLLAGLIEEQGHRALVLGESEALFRSLADTAPVLIWMSGVDKLYSFFNKAWLDFTGRLQDQELGYGWTDGLHRDDFNHYLETYLNCFNAREEFSVEFRLRRHDGKYCWLLARGAPRFGAHGAFLGYIGSAIDITQRKQTETELRQQRAELAHMTRVSTMGELAASLAHELNQPLTAILSNAQAAQRLMANDPADFDEVRAILADIVHDDSRAGEVIHRMRALVRKETREFVALNLSTIISEVVALLHSDAILHNVRVTVELTQHLPPVHGDKVQVQQVVLNLLLNAFDAMKDGRHSEREVAVWTEASSADTVRVGVRDGGPGLSGEIRNRVFEPFFTTKREGIGMGLSISRTIVEAHGGHLWAENNPDAGATFYFTMPIARENVTENSSGQLVGSRSG